MTGRSERVVLVLSGGGVKTAAHLGAWRAFDEAGLRPSHVVATSMGAVIAAGLGAGVGSTELLARLTSLGRGGIVRDRLAVVAGIFARSLLKPEPLRRAIEAFVPARRFEDLARPLTVPVVDLDTGELLLYGAGGRDAPLIDVLCATCALPLYYPPVRLDGRRCADGGLRGVLPLEAAGGLAAGADRVLAVDVGPGLDAVLDDDDEPTPLPSLVRAHNDTVRIVMAAGTAAQLALWRADPGRPPLLYVRPRVERDATFRIERAERYADEGYRAARQALDSAA